jgi:lysophospholipase L1-like esterase
MQRIYFALLVTVLFANCDTQKIATKNFATLQGNQLVTYGRHHKTQTNGLELITGAANFGISFYGKAIIIKCKAGYNGGHNWLQYELDGKYVAKKIRVNDDTTNTITIETDKSGTHELWIYKATEAHTGPIYIQNVLGNKLKVLQKKFTKKIEFIGNSITCGAAADPSEIPCNIGDYHDHHNAYMSYASVVARTLKVDYVLNSISGAGIYRNWNSNGPTVPELYDFKNLTNDKLASWDQSTNNPNIISIALGTNDFSNGDGKKLRAPFDKNMFIEKYIAFVKKLKYLHPKAIVALTDSPMVNGENKIKFNLYLQEIKAGVDASFPENKVQLFSYKPMVARGCSGHPNVEDHQIMANEIMDFYKNLLGE